MARRRSANPSRTYASAGTFSATLTVTDNRGGAASNSVVITVTPAPIVSMRVSAITGAALAQGANKYARVTLTVLDANNQPVPGAVVSGAWSGLVSGNGSATTNASGQAVIDSPRAKKSGNVTFTVSGVTKSGFTYNAATSVTTRTVAIP